LRAEGRKYVWILDIEENGNGIEMIMITNAGGTFVIGMASFSLGNFVIIEFRVIRLQFLRKFIFMKNSLSKIAILIWNLAVLLTFIIAKKPAQNTTQPYCI
jgi:hypothetical protein